MIARPATWAELGRRLDAAGVPAPDYLDFHQLDREWFALVLTLVHEHSHLDALLGSRELEAVTGLAPEPHAAESLAAGHAVL